MILDNESAIIALNCFGDKDIPAVEAANIVKFCADTKDILYHVLANTDFLSKNPKVRKIISNLSAPVHRSLQLELDHSSIPQMLRRAITTELYEKQRMWAEQSKQLTGLEKDILRLKKNLSALA